MSMSLNKVNLNAVADKRNGTIVKPEESSNYLSESAIYYHQARDEKTTPDVPPNTPQNTILHCHVTKPPKIPENVDNIPIPLVREVGIRDSLAMLANYFGCENYKVNLAQFWFLDIVVDIIWRCQDEFRFPVEYQTVILNWIMFVIRLVSEKHMTKAKLFLIFKEALEIAEEYIQSGCKNPPSPNELFILKEENHSQKSFTSLENKESASSVDTTKPSQMCIVVELGDQILNFKVPRTVPLVNTIECTSSIESISSYERLNLEDKDRSKDSSIASSDSENFWKPNWGTPDRFKSLTELKSQSIDSKTSSSSKSTTTSENVSQFNEVNNDGINTIRKPGLPSCPSIVEEADIQKSTKTSKIRQKSKDLDLEHENSRLAPASQSKKEILKAFYVYNLWNLKNEYMTDPTKGWTPFDKKPSSKNLYTNIPESKGLEAKKKILNYLKSEQETLKELNKIIFINTGVLVVINHFVYDYFGDDFCFILAKNSLQDVQPLWTQDLNTEWKIPKLIKGEVKKPLVKKPKIEKKTLEKALKIKKSLEKKLKSDKSSKKSKKDSKKEKKVKADTRANQKLKLKEKHEEEKRLKKEAELLDQERLKELENKTFMFPLKEAVDDQFFSQIFKDYKIKKGKEINEKNYGKKSFKKHKK